MLPNCVTFPAMARRIRLSWLPIGAFFLICLHWRMLSPAFSIPWDASDFMLPVQHWFGSAVRHGHDPSWMPHLAGGYPVGRELQFGFMGLVHPTAAVLFRGTTLAITTPILLMYVLSYAAAFGIARLNGLRPWSAMFAGLWTACSGFWLGNASHLPILTAVTASLIIALSLFAFARRRRWAPLCTVAGFVLGINGSYPTTLFFGCQIVGVLAILLLIRRRISLRGFCGFAVAVAVGIASGLPTLLSTATWFAKTPRSGGVSAEECMRQSTAPQALATFFTPLIKVDECKWPGSTDVTLDRFHLTFTAIPLLGAALLCIRRWRWRGWTCALLVLLAADFTSGRNGIIREWLAHQFWFERLNHCLPADHAWLLPAALAMGLAAFVDAAGGAWVRRRWLVQAALAVVLFVDAAVVMSGIGLGLVYGKAWPPWHPGRAPSFQSVWLPQDQPALDAGRLRPATGNGDITNTAAIPDRMLPWGFVAATVADYERDFFAGRRDWICGRGKLRDGATGAPVTYRLERYEPTSVKIVVPADAPRDIVWNDVDDGWWRATANGAALENREAPSGLRRYRLPPGEVTLRMSYAPAIPIWSGWAAAWTALAIGAIWSRTRRRPTRRRT